MNNTNFDDLILGKFLPIFCQFHGYDTAGFKSETVGRVVKYDAEWFLRALSTRTVVQDGSFFMSPLSGAKEQIFWSGNKSVIPRPITFWAEPVITIGAAGRLSSEFGWPQNLIGLQSKRNWAFDLVAYSSDQDPIIVCEVKKSEREIDFLIRAMMDFVSLPPLDEEPNESKLRNAYRKVVGLRQMAPKYFWALGPNDYGSVFRIAPGGLEEVGKDVLAFVPPHNSA